MTSRKWDITCFSGDKHRPFTSIRLRRVCLTVVLGRLDGTPQDPLKIVAESESDWGGFYDGAVYICS
jgi:hypothetical protein